MTGATEIQDIHLHIQNGDTSRGSMSTRPALHSLARLLGFNLISLPLLTFWSFFQMQRNCTEIRSVKSEVGIITQEPHRMLDLSTESYIVLQENIDILSFSSMFCFPSLHNQATLGTNSSGTILLAYCWDGPLFLRSTTSGFLILFQS